MYIRHYNYVTMTTDPVDFRFAVKVPAFRCELRVEGLSPGEKYVCAVAAYTADGQLIGGSIGETTKPILASHPMSLLLTWAFLCQVNIHCDCMVIVMVSRVYLFGVLPILLRRVFGRTCPIFRCRTRWAVTR